MKVGLWKFNKGNILEVVSFEIGIIICVFYRFSKKPSMIKAKYWNHKRN